MEFFENTFKNRHEHTLGGAVIGTVRDLFEDTPESDVKKAMRARSNDQTAGFIGDTAAFIPAMKWTAAGALKAGLMYDPHASGRDNAVLFAKNFGEGAAINLVSKLGTPEGALTKFTTRKFGQGLLAEGVTHLGTGVGLGAIKTGFDVNAWKDASGNTSLLAGAEHIAAGGAFTGMLNVPAQMIGLRVGKASTLGLARSPEMANALTSITSGYASGTVFGGVEAWNAGKGWKETLGDMHKAGVTGAFTGLVVSRFTRPAETTAEKMVRSDATERMAAPERHLRRADSTKPRFTESAWTDGTLDINPLKNRENLIELTRRLTAVRREQMEFSVPKKGAKTEGFKNWEDFDRTQNRVKRNVLVYTISGHGTEIVIPEDHAATLTSIRRLRQLTDHRIPATELKMGETERAAKFKANTEELNALPNKFDALPEDFVALLDELPHRGLVKRIVITDGEDPSNPWSRQEYKRQIAELERQQGKEAVSDDLRELANTFKAAASANEDGELTFFRPKVGDTLRNNMFHEWAHLVKFAYPNISGAFDTAARLDRYHSSEYSKKTDHENFAVHFGEQFTSWDADQFSVVTSEAPLKSAVFGHALMRTLKDAPSSGRSIFATQFANRISYTENEVLPKAYKVLDEHIARGKDEQAVDALALYGFIGGEQHIPKLASIAKNSHHPQMAQEAMSSALGLSRTPEARFKLLFELAQPGSQVQEDAQLLLESLPDGRAKAYGKYIENIRKGGDIKGLVNLVGEMPDLAGKEMVFQQALRLAGDNTNVRNAVAVRVMQMEPSIRERAFDALTIFGDSQAIRHIEPFTRHADRKVQAMARETIKQINIREAMPGWERAFASGTTREQLDAVDEMTIVHDNKLIRPLLQAAAATDGSVRSRAIQALGHYSPALVKFEARTLGQMNPTVRKNLDAVLQRAI